MDSTITSSADPVKPHSPFRGGGATGELIRQLDWANTPLGAVSGWPQSLITAVNLILSAKFPMMVHWGDELVHFYNDGYATILQEKHPGALGAPARAWWGEIWDFLTPIFKAVLEGQTTYFENQLVLPNRRGFVEEAYFTFSHSPIYDETGRVGGILATALETTQSVVNQRRLATLSDLVSRTTPACDLSEAGSLMMDSLATNPHDVPFALLYLLEENGHLLRLAAHTGFADSKRAFPEATDLQGEGATSIWPLKQVLQHNQGQRVGDLHAESGHFPGGTWPEPCREALLLPVPRASQPAGETSLPYGVLVLGVSPRRPLDEAYQSFFALLAEHAARTIARAKAQQEERARLRTLAEIDQAKTVFFSNVSHEFRTPLTLMLAPLEGLLAQPLPAAHHQELSLVYRNGLRLLTLVNTLLDFSRLEAGRLQAHFQPVDLAALTAELASTFRSAVEQAGLRLRVDCPPLPEPVFADPQLWERIIFNLLSNAFKFTFRGEISVSLRAKANRAELVVADTGTGIAADQQPRLFTRFHRVEGAPGRSQEGSGIGLAMVQELVKLHGGDIRVESTLGEGSRFWVTLPFGKEHLPREQISPPSFERKPALPPDSQTLPSQPELSFTPDPDNRAAPYPPAGNYHTPSLNFMRGYGVTASGPDPSLAQSTVLVVDDNADMRGYLVRLLGQHYRVVPAADGAQALSVLAAEVPDLILSDVMMPELDGFTLLESLRARENTRTVPFLLLSARAGAEARVEGLEAGADDYIVKPFSARELLAKVATQLELARLRKKLLEEEKQARIALEQAQQTLAEQHQLLIHTSQTMETILHLAAHDLRGPVSNIGQLLALLPAKDPEWKEAHVLSLLTSSVQQLERTLNGLIRLVQLQTDENEGATRLVFAQVFEMVKASLGETLTGSGGRFEIDFSQAPEVHYVAPFLESILKNLMSNALKYRAADRSPLIRITTQRAKESVLLTVEDNGMGMNLQKHGKDLFKPFKRFTSKAEGTGLGLHLVKNMVERNGGNIQVYSQPGEGTRFVVHLKEYTSPIPAST